MNSFSKILYFLLLFSGLASLVSKAGSEAGNGGDGFSLEFVSYAYRILDEIEREDLTQRIVDAALFRNVLASTKVESKKNLKLGNSPKDAINFPSQKLIQIDRDRWLELRTFTNLAYSLILHEYLGIMGIDDSTYSVSNSFLSRLKLLGSRQDFGDGFFCQTGAIENAPTKYISRFEVKKINDKFNFVELRFWPCRGNGCPQAGFKVQKLILGTNLECKISSTDKILFKCDKKNNSTFSSAFSSSKQVHQWLDSNGRDRLKDKLSLSIEGPEVSKVFQPNGNENEHYSRQMDFNTDQCHAN